MTEQEPGTDEFQNDLEDQMFAEFKSTNATVTLFSDERLTQLSSLEFVEALVSFAAI